MAENLLICESELTNELLDTLIQMSSDWEDENSCRGYCKNDPSDIEGNRIFLAKLDGKVIGYLFGHMELAKNSSSVMQESTCCFEVEELYVVPECRGTGVGSALFCYAEEKARESGASYVTLSTATKAHKRILHFYIDELGMEFWSARLFKKIS